LDILAIITARESALYNPLYYADELVYLLMHHVLNFVHMDLAFLLSLVSYLEVKAKYTFQPVSSLSS